MKIKKELKNATFEYDEEKKVFTISVGDGLYSTVELNKVYSFAFMRFVVRIAQRNWLKGKKAVDRIPKDVASSDSTGELSLAQMLIFED